jgi:hypothetical protein
MLFRFTKKHNVGENKEIHSPNYLFHNYNSLTMKKFKNLLFFLTAFVLSLTSADAIAQAHKTPSLGLSVPSDTVRPVRPVRSAVVVAPIDLTTTPNTVVPLIDISQLTPANVLDKMIDPIYSALVLLLGLLSSFIPGLQKIENKAIRVLAIGISLGLGFLMFGGATFWKLALSYVFANLSYIITFKGLFNRPKEAPTLA